MPIERLPTISGEAVRCVQSVNQEISGGGCWDVGIVSLGRSVGQVSADCYSDSFLSIVVGLLVNVLDVTITKNGATFLLT